MSRSTSYKPDYCNEIIECLAKGHSIAAFAGEIGVAASTVYKWITDIEEFAQAYAIAKAKAIRFWETKLIEIADSGKGNVTAIIFGLKNRAAEEWRDVQKFEHTGKDGEPIKTEEVSARDEIHRRIAGLVARSETVGSSGKPH